MDNTEFVQGKEKQGNINRTRLSLIDKPNFFLTI